LVLQEVCGILVAQVLAKTWQENAWEVTKSKLKPRAVIIFLPNPNNGQTLGHCRNIRLVIVLVS
jgi:hypothetical protein